MEQSVPRRQARTDLMISGVGGNRLVLLSHLKLERGRDGERVRRNVMVSILLLRRPEFDGAQQGWESILLTAFED